MTPRNDHNPSETKGTPEEVLAWCDAHALAATEAVHEVDHDHYADLDENWTDEDLCGALESYYHGGGWWRTRAPLIVRRSVPVAVLGQAEGWEAPVVARLPDPVAEERDRLRAEVREYEEDCAVCPEDQTVTETVGALRAEVERLTAWLYRIEGGDHPCEDAEQLRRWAYEAITLRREVSDE